MVVLVCARAHSSYCTCVRARGSDRPRIQRSARATAHAAAARRPPGACPAYTRIEVLNLRPAVKKAIILLLYRGFVKVLKDALAHLGPYQTLTKPRYSDPGGEY